MAGAAELFEKILVGFEHRMNFVEQGIEFRDAKEIRDALRFILHREQEVMARSAQVAALPCGDCIVRLCIELSCSSFTQAARAVASGGYAAVLPNVASARFDDAKVMRFDLPFLKGHTCPLVLAWHPRTEARRDVLTHAKETLSRLL